MEIRGGAAGAFFGPVSLGDFFVLGSWRRRRRLLWTQNEVFDEKCMFYRNVEKSYRELSSIFHSSRQFPKKNLVRSCFPQIVISRAFCFGILKVLKKARQKTLFFRRLTPRRHYFIANDDGPNVDVDGPNVERNNLVKLPYFSGALCPLHPPEWDMMGYDRIG